MLRYKDPNTTPPGGRFPYTESQTGYSFREITLQNLIRVVKNHRIGNSLPIGVNINAEIEDASCRELMEKYPDFKPACWNWWSDAGITGIHHADKGETEVAHAVGSPVLADRIKDYSFKKPWHQVRSRFAVQPESGGINGKPSDYDPAEGARIREQVVRVLTDKVMEAIGDKE